MARAFVYVFGNGRGGSYYPEHSSMGKLIGAALEELGTVFFSQSMPGTWKHFSNGVNLIFERTQDQKLLCEEQGVCDGEGIVWKTLWRQHKRAFLTTPEVTALENLLQERPGSSEPGAFP